MRDYFLDNNDGWQMQALTRHVQEDEDRERQRKRDAEAEKVRQGDANRQGSLPWRTGFASFCYSFFRRLVELPYRRDAVFVPQTRGESSTEMTGYVRVERRGIRNKIEARKRSHTFGAGWVIFSGC